MFLLRIGLRGAKSKLNSILELAARNQEREREIERERESEIETTEFELRN